MTTNHPNSSWVFQDDSNGQGIYIKEWRSTLPQPTLASAYSNWPVASVWKSNEVKNVQCNFDKWNAPELRALVKVLLQENNRWRKWMEDFKLATSNSTSLADFKVRVAVLPGTPQVSVQQLKEQILEKLD